LSLIYFYAWNRFQEHPIVDFSFFRNRNFLLGTVTITLGYLIYFAGTVTLPLWLQTEQGYTPYWAGVAVAPVGVVPFFLSMLVGKYLYKFDLRFVAITSFIFLGAAFFYQANFTTQVDLPTIMLARFLQGFGIAIFFLPLVQLSLSGIPKEKYASATGIFNF